MSDFTLGQIRALINPQSFPSTINGGAVSTADKNALINKCREAWYYTPDPDRAGALWLGARSPQVLTVTTQPDRTQTLTLSIGFGKIELANDGYGPLQVRNQWFQYRETPPVGQFTRTLDDLGYGFCGIVDFPTTGSGFTLTTTGAEAGSLVATIFGLNSTGSIISETLTLPTSSGPVNSVNTYYGIRQIIMPVTANNVVASQTVGAIFFALYSPGQTSPNFRRYRLNTGYSNQTTISAICVRKYYPLIADSDPCEFGSVLAFEVALRAYQYMLNMDMDHYRSGLAEAIGYLNGELAASMNESDLDIAQLEFTTSPGAVMNML